jgi:hypothetical protein
MTAIGHLAKPTSCANCASQSSERSGSGRFGRIIEAALEGGQSMKTICKWLEGQAEMALGVTSVHLLGVSSFCL